MTDAQEAREGVQDRREGTKPGEDGLSHTAERQEANSGVAVGQVWADNDPRCEGRQVRIIELDATHATVEVIANRRPDHRLPFTPGRRTRIRLDRLKPTSTGYRLITEEQA